MGIYTCICRFGQNSKVQSLMRSMTVFQGLIGNDFHYFTKYLELFSHDLRGYVHVYLKNKKTGLTSGGLTQFSFCKSLYTMNPHVSSPQLSGILDYLDRW